MTFRSQAIRDMCRTVCIGCGADDGTIVPAHRNESKGMGLKSSDATCVPLCAICHSAYDRSSIPLAEKRAMWEFWFGKWGPTVIERLAGVNAKPKPLSSSKVLPRVGYSR